MKKRSVLSAVAMLLVSAIVLTSATYAWFASGSSASVTTVTATVSNSDGTLLISADGGTTWKTTVAMGADPKAAGAYGDFTASTLTYPDITESTAGQLTPVSCIPASGDIGTPMGGALSGTAFSSSPVTEGWVMFQVLVKSSVNATITVDPNFATAVNFGYCYFVVNGTGYLFGNAASRQYNPIAYSASEVTGVDGNGNAIMDSSEGVVLAAQQTTVAQGNSYTITATHGVSYTVTCYMWVEGQDAACTGSIATAQLSCGIGFTKANVTTTA